MALVELMFAVPALHGWYRSLTAPPGTPPYRLVMDVWALLYVLLGCSAWLVWRRAGVSRPLHYRALRLWGWQLMVQTGWTLAFFGLHALLVGVLLVAVMALLGVETFRQFSLIDRRAAWLMTPYLAWTGYALWLSAGFWWLNQA